MPNDLGLTDFRSDTVTKPSPAMREAMARARVGDDVFGDDPTVIELEAEAVRIFGKEAALYVPSGTMGNLIAIKLHTQPGDEMIVEARAHMYSNEGGGSAAFCGVQARVLESARGLLSPEDVRKAVRPDDPHCPRTRLVAVENTHNFHGGHPLPIAGLRALNALTYELGLAFHIDGARIFNAAVATGEG